MERELHLSATEIGLLAALPAAFFGIAALAGSLLITRFDALRTAIAGLVIAGVASAMRGFADDVLALYAATAAMGAGVAIMHPALPSLVRQWLPARVSFGSAVYTNGLLVGETLPVALTVPVLLPLLSNSWRGSLIAWSIPLLLIAMAAYWAAPGPRAFETTQNNTSAWWPNWGDRRIWQGGLVLGAVASTYFGTCAFVPSYLAASGRADLVTPVLTALNLSQLPASFVMLAMADRLERRVFPFIVVGVFMMASLAGLVATASMWTIAFAAMLGAAIAAAITLALALPALLSRPTEVAQISAAVFTIGYIEALLISILAGSVADETADIRLAFLPILVSLVPFLVVPPTIQLGGSGDVTTS